MATNPNTAGGEINEPCDDPEELERWKRWCMEARLMRDALQLENNALRGKVKRMFDWACKASAALDNQDHEHACDCIARAKLAANAS